MRKTSDRCWLEMAEYISLASSVAGSVAAAASQQIVYAAAPLTLALSLSLVNRQRFQQQFQQQTTVAIANVRQEVQFLHNKIQVPPPVERFSDIEAEASTLKLKQAIQVVDNRQELVQVGRKN